LRIVEYLGDVPDKFAERSVALLENFALQDAQR
jgi:hypothetical protein